MASPKTLTTLIMVIILMVDYSDGRLDRSVRSLQASGAHVCTEKRNYYYKATIYYAVRYLSSYKAGCGLFNWWKCTRYREKYRRRSREVLRSGTNIYYKCCNGWTRSYSGSSECTKAICYRGCNNGGRCASPDVCVCAPGWSGSTCSDDVNECGANNGGCEQDCVNLVGKGNVCLCRRGFRKRNLYSTKCVDVDECHANRKLCNCADGSYGCGGRCINTHGSFRCSCGEGYRLFREATCVDINECSLGACGKDKCINSPGSFHCLCRRGFHKVNETCKDIDECANNNGFCEHTRSTCENIPGSYRCICRPGFLLDDSGRTCSDFDECSTFHGCQEKCVNTVGGYHCECSRGYRLKDNQRTCTDIDECTAENITGTNYTVKLAHCQQLCINVPGSYECSCTDGYNLAYDKKRCSDVDECTTGKHHCSQICRNTVGSYRCSCSAGYKLGTDGKTCEGSVKKWKGGLLPSSSSAIGGNKCS